MWIWKYDQLWIWLLNQRHNASGLVPRLLVDTSRLQREENHWTKLDTSVWVWGTKWRSSHQITSILFSLTFAVSSTRQVLRCLPPCQALRCWWNLNDCLGVVVNRKNAMKSPNSRGNVRFETKHPTILAYLGNMAVMPCDVSQLEGQDVCRWLGFPKAGVPAVLTQWCWDLMRMKPNHRISVRTMNNLCELLCRSVRKPKIHHNPKNWNPCFS